MSKKKQVSESFRVLLKTVSHKIGTSTYTMWGPFYFKIGLSPLPPAGEASSRLEQVRTNSVAHQFIHTNYIN